MSDLRKEFEQIATSGSLAADYTTDPINLRGTSQYLMQANWFGSDAVGTISVELSNDKDNDQLWTTVTNSSVAISGSTTSPSAVITYDRKSPELWCRLAYTRTSGSGSVNVNINRVLT